MTLIELLLQRVYGLAIIALNSYLGLIDARCCGLCLVCYCLRPFAETLVQINT